MKRESTFEVPRHLGCWVGASKVESSRAPVRSSECRGSCVALESQRLTIDTGNLGPHWGKRNDNETRSPYLQIQFSIFGNSGDLVHKCSVELAIIAKSVTLITLASHFFELSVTY